MAKSVTFSYELKLEKFKDYIPGEGDSGKIFYETLTEGMIYRLEYFSGSEKFLDWMEMHAKERVDRGIVEKYETFGKTEHGMFLYLKMNKRYHKGPMKGRYTNTDAIIFDILGPATIINGDIAYSKGRSKIVKQFLVIDDKKLNPLFKMLDRNFEYDLVNISDVSKPMKAELLCDVIGQKITRKQMDVLKLAFENGYYESPKRTSMEKIADGLSVSTPTVFQHLQSAEKKIIRAVLEKLG